MTGPDGLPIAETRGSPGAGGGPQTKTLAFAVVTETIFAWPGMGKLVIDSIFQLDRPIVVAYLLVVVFMFILINLVVDLLYSILDPRVRLADVKS